MDQLPPGVPLSAIPAQAPPTGVVPDFDNNYLAPTAIAVFSITIGLEVIFLYFRLQTKWSHKTNLLVDDCGCPNIESRTKLTDNRVCNCHLFPISRSRNMLDAEYVILILFLRRFNHP